MKFRLLKPLTILSTLLIIFLCFTASASAFFVSSEKTRVGNFFSFDAFFTRNFLPLTADNTPDKNYDDKKFASDSLLATKSVTASFEHATQVFNKGPLTNVGRALTKHPNIIGESGNLLQKLGGAANVNKTAAEALQNIMQNGTMTTKVTKAFGEVIEYKLPSGLGARFNATTGEFIGFLGRGL